MASSAALADGPPTAARAVAMHDLIAADAQALSAKLQSHRQRLFPPKARKQLRRFSSGEAARLIGVDDGYLRRLSLDGKDAGDRPDRPALLYERDIQALRLVLDEGAKTGRRYGKEQRRTDEHLQAVASSTSRAVPASDRRPRRILPSISPCRAIASSAVDLDRQPVGLAWYPARIRRARQRNPLRGDPLRRRARRPLAEVIQETYFPGLDPSPGQSPN